MNVELSIKEAKVALNEGSKIKHRLFTNDEYIYKKNGQLYDEQNTPLVEITFFNMRNSSIWQTGWTTI